MMSNSPIPNWHRVVVNFDVEKLAKILADDCTFYSPVVFKPQKGKDLTIKYLSSAFEMFSKADYFKYVQEIEDQNSAVLEFNSEMDGIFIDGIDMITWNDEGLITEFKVMIRPLQAINKVRETMMAQLGQSLGMKDRVKIKLMKTLQGL